MARFTRPVRPTWRATSANRNGDEGSVLILAFIYLVAVAITVTGLTGWAANDLNNSQVFTSTRQLQEAARSTTEFAIQSIRYTPELSSTQNASPPAACWGSSSTSSLTIAENGTSYTIDVWCSTVWNPTSADTRVVTLSACNAAVTTSASTCAASPYLQVVVTFDDYPPGGAAAVSGPCTDWGWCGQGQAIDSWIWA
jgi:hypothetical protein